MIYMSSTSTSQGVVQIQVTFDIGTDADKAALNVNNRVKQAEPRLPLEVRRQGVTVEKGSSAFLQVLAFYSPDGRHDDVFISNYVTLNVLDLLKRVPGTTNVQIFGAKDYAMRIWVQPDRMAQHRLTPARPDPRGERAERAVRRRQGRAVARARGAGAGLHDHHARAPVGSEGVRGNPRAHQPRRLVAAAEGRGARRARLQGLRLHRPHQRQGGDAGGRLPAARRQRAGGRGRREAHGGRHRQALPAGPRLLGALRHHALRRGVDQGGGRDAAHRDGCSCSWWCISSCRTGARR